MNSTLFTIDDVNDELESAEECISFGDQLPDGRLEFHARARRAIRRARLMARALAVPPAVEPTHMPTAVQPDTICPTTVIKIYPVIPPNPNAWTS